MSYMIGLVAIVVCMHSTIYGLDLSGELVNLQEALAQFQSSIEGNHKVNKLKFLLEKMYSDIREIDIAQEVMLVEKSFKEKYLEPVIKELFRTTPTYDKPGELFNLIHASIKPLNSNLLSELYDKVRDALNISWGEVQQAKVDEENDAKDKKNGGKLRNIRVAFREAIRSIKRIDAEVDKGAHHNENSFKNYQLKGVVDVLRVTPNKENVNETIKLIQKATDLIDDLSLSGQFKTLLDELNKKWNEIEAAKTKAK